VSEVLNQLHPAGWTSRRTYRLAILCGAAVLVALNVIFSISGLPAWLIAVLDVLTLIPLVLLTIRRLRDAGLSVWISLLLFFPFGMRFDLATITVSGFAFQLIDFGSVIRVVPLMLGLALRSQPVERRVL
jgi:uncharacterized membrane protein YhaH (DUF805 family)